MGDDNRCEQRQRMIHGQTLIMRQRRIRMLLGVCFCFIWLVSVQAGVSGRSSGSITRPTSSGSVSVSVSASATRRACSVSMVRGVALLDLIPRGGAGGSSRNKSSPENTSLRGPPRSIFQTIFRRGTSSSSYKDEDENENETQHRSMEPTVSKSSVEVATDANADADSDATATTKEERDARRRSRSSMASTYRDRKCLLG
jgi:hypothetical protein